MHYLSMLALAAPRAGQGAEQPNPILAFAPIIFMFVIFYFILIRPQRKRQKDHEALVETLKKGDKVVTSGGIVGTVVGTKEKEIVIKVGDDSVKLEIIKSCVSQVVKS